MNEKELSLLIDILISYRELIYKFSIFLPEALFKIDTKSIDQLIDKCIRLRKDKG